MGLLEDLNSGKYNLILFSVLFVLIFHQYWSKPTNESMVNLADIPSDDTIKNMVKEVYNADVEAIRNLSNVATQLQSGGLTIPGDLNVKGTLNIVPSGSIIAFNSEKAPDGWTLCDGTNGTPDLRGRFIRMQSDSLGGFNDWGGKVIDGNKTSYDKTIGGNSRDDPNSWILNHKFGDKAGTDHHQLNINEIPTHSHACSIGNAAESRKVKSNSGTQFDEPGHSTSGGGFWGDRFVHNHTCAIGNTGASWGHNNQPPYYVLSYIMKL